MCPSRNHFGGWRKRSWNKIERLGLVEVAEDLAGNVLATGLLVVHDTGRGGEHDVAERTGGQELLHPVLDLAELHVEAGRDHTALVDAAVELDHDLARAVVIDLLELADVAWILHQSQSDN
ncbi:hypothetical protein L1887_62058 [Cichorium endivia]|nr:hypothetical protein L1887_62058 [Cichorium endivia]